MDEKVRKPDLIKVTGMRKLVKGERRKLLWAVLGFTGH